MRLKYPALFSAGRIGLRASAFCAALLLLSPAEAWAQCISLTTPGAAYTQNFDTLSNVAASTTNNLTIPGWSLTEAGGGARDNEQYAVDTGSGTTGDTMSYGSAASTDRALGGLLSGTLVPTIGACFTNNTGSPMSSFGIAYTGEQWRLTAGHTPDPDRLDFQYSLDATDLTNGTWTDVNALDFNAPSTGTTGARDGNAAANRTALSFSVSATIPSGATFRIRWTDFNAVPGADDGLAVDDFSLTPPVPVNPPVVPTCPASLSTFQGTATSGSLSATDADGTVVSATITGITPSNPGTISITGFTPAGGAGGTATGTLSVSNATPAGSYSVTVQWANNDGVPQTGSCVVGVTVTLPPVVPTCPASLATPFGTAAGGAMSATDADGTVVSATITGITPSNPGTISITGFTPAGGSGGTATGTLSLSNTTPVGNYSATIQWANNDGSPQTASCVVAITVGTPALIHDVQGSGAATPMNGALVSVEGVVVATFQGASKLQGFFLQEEDGAADADPNTSEGIFVFCNSCPTAVVEGQRVRAIGTVSEFFNMTEITANSAASVAITDPGNNLADVTAAALSLPITGGVDAFYEAREGMLVSFANTLTVSEYFELGQLGQIILTEGGRPFQYTETKTPSTPGYVAHLLDLSRRQVILDDDTNAQNAYLSSPEGSQALFYPRANGGFSVGTQGTDYFRGGDLVNNLTGVLHWSFSGVGGSDAWRIRPTQASPVTFTVANPRPATPPAVGGAIKAVSMNLLNYFTTIDNTPGNSGPCGPSGTLDCRGADSVAELNRQRERAAVVICGLNADVYGFMELENTASATITDLLGPVNTSCGGSHPYTAVTTGGTLGTDAIRVQLVYRSGILSPVGPALVDMDPVHNRPPTAQTFDVVDATNPAFGQRFTVIASHFKSKGCGGATGGNVDAGDGQGCFSADRTDQATRLLTWTNGTVIPAPAGANGDPDVLLLGDFNSYAKEPPVTTLTGGGYVDVETAMLGTSAYSYLFDSQLGHLDYAFASTSLYSQVAGIGAWHINADEVAIFDYNDEIKDTGEAPFEEKPNGSALTPPRVVFEASTAARAADHDPILIGLFPLAPVVISPTSVVTSASTAALGGNVTSVGSSPLTDRGVVYAPTATNADPLIAGPGVTQVSAGAGSTGVFNVGVTGLTPTGYSFKAYATNATGTSYTTVDTFSMVTIGPHGTPATATPLTLGPNGAVKVHGEIFPAADIDYYSFTANAGDVIYAATMTAGSAARTDSQLALLDTNGVTKLDFDDDNGSFSSNSSSITGAVIPSTGTYYLKVNDYLVSAGQELGYDLYVQVRTGTPTAETEPNDTPATADSGSTWFSGGSVAAFEQDWYAIPLSAGDTVFASLDASSLYTLGLGLVGSPGDPSAMMLTGKTAMFLTVKDAGTYYARVGSAASGGDPYNLSITVFPRVPVGVNPTTYTSTDVPKTIGPGAGLVSSTLAVPGNPRIASIRVNLDLSHALTQDLDVHLRSPAGNDIGLFTDIGSPIPGTLTQFVVTFADDAATPPPSADDHVTPLPTSVLRGLVLKPEREYRLAWLNGEDAGGTWTLDIRDDGANASGGTLNGWSLEISEMPAAPAGGVIFATDFESGAAGFTHSGTADEWALGTPATAATTTSLPVAAFTTAHSGVNAWKTDLTGTYGPSSIQDLVSPNIDLTGVTGPITLQWAQKYQLGSAALDHAYVEVQEVAGPATTRKVWEWLDGAMTDAVGNPEVNIGASAGWGLMRADITDFAGKVVRVLFHLDSNVPGNLGGLAIDDVSVTGTGTPVVTTPTSASITTTTAALGGTVVSDAGSAVTERGVVYSLTTANADPIIGGIGVTKVTAPGTTGAFSQGVVGLTASSTYTFKAYATNAVGTGYTPPATFSTPGACPTITLASLMNGIVNVPYAGSAAATGGTGPYTYAITSGALPTGLSLTPNGAGAGDVTGTPNPTGVFTFEITATDANTCTGAQSYTVTIGSSIAAGELVIRDFRWRGPLGAEDEYVEVFNKTSGTVTIAATDGSPGYGIVSESIGLIVHIPNGTEIAAGGSYLATNITPGTGYSLNDYGGTGMAIHDASWNTDVPDASGVGLFRSTTTFDVSTTRIDAVGFTGSLALYREGAGLAPASGITAGGEWVFTRRAPYPLGAVKDTGDNAQDFNFVSTTAGIYGVQSALGSPGPLNLGAPRSVILPSGLADPTLGENAAPNRIQVGNVHYFRRKVTNNTGAAITKLRFRVADIATLQGLGYGVGGQADGRALTTVDASISVLPGPVVVTAKGLTLELPSIPFSSTGKGGGYDASFVVDLTSIGGSLPAGDSLYVNIGFRSVKGGAFYFILVPEVLN